MYDWGSSMYFSSEEFDSPDRPGSGELMSQEFMDMLTWARELAEVPFHITSGYRTPDHNKKVGGVANSPHRNFVAADISTLDSRTRYRVLWSLISVGFNRIGIGKNFIHVDLDRSKPPEVVWGYYD